MKLPARDHLTKIPIGSSVSQIAISETSRKRPPPVSDHLIKIPIGSSASYIAISETSCKRSPPVSDHLSLTSRVVAYGRFHCIKQPLLFLLTLSLPKVKHGGGGGGGKPLGPGYTLICWSLREQTSHININENIHTKQALITLESILQTWGNVGQHIRTIKSLLKELPSIQSVRHVCNEMIKSIRYSSPMNIYTVYKKVGANIRQLLIT